MKDQITLGPPIPKEPLPIGPDPEDPTDAFAQTDGPQRFVLKRIEPWELPPPEPEIENPLPTLNLLGVVRATEVEEFVFAFTSGYFHIPLDELSGETDLYWLEKRALALYEGVAIEDVQYHRIFTRPDGSGGIFDCGFTVFFYVYELTDAMGLHIRGNGPRIY